MKIHATLPNVVKPMETLPKLVKPMETSSSLAYVQRFADERDDHGEVDESADDPADDQHSVEPQPISAGSFACANRKTSLPNLIKNDYTEREREREGERERPGTMSPKPMVVRLMKEK